MRHGDCASDNSIVMMRSSGLDAPGNGLSVKASQQSWQNVGFPKGVNPADANWHLVGYSYDGAGNILVRFDDKTRSARVDSWPTGINADDTIYIGSCGDGSRRLNGAVAGLLIVHRVLSATEADVLYRMGLGVPPNPP